VFISINAITTIYFVERTGSPGFFQLRYNMRVMPVAMVGVAWLLVIFVRRWQRLAIWTGAFVLLLAALPTTWHLMETYKSQFLEQAFTRAIATGKDQEGTRSEGGYIVGVAPERDMATYIRTRFHSDKQILTDDAKSFAVMLFTGKPALFVDRIQKGDASWLEVRRSPWGKVSYLLVSKASLDDLVNLRYPFTWQGKVPGMTPVYQNSRWALIRVARHAPRPLHT
jgi:hypothetical protein